jgi:hypothetical protein
MQDSFLIADLMFVLVPLAVAVYGNDPESPGRHRFRG